MVWAVDHHAGPSRHLLCEILYLGVRQRICHQRHQAVAGHQLRCAGYHRSLLLLRITNFAARVGTRLIKFDHSIPRAGWSGRALIWAFRHLVRCVTCIPTVVVARCIMHTAVAVREPENVAKLLHTYADSRGCERVTRQDNTFRPSAMRTAL